MISNDTTMEALYKVTHALGLVVEVSYRGLYGLKSLDDDANSNMNVEFITTNNTRLIIADSPKTLLARILNSPCFYIPLIRGKSYSFILSHRTKENPFYSLSIEEAIIKADLLCNGV